MSEKAGGKRKTKPKAEITAEDLEACARAGFTIAETALHLGVDERTIYRHKAEKSELSDAIKKGKLAAHLNVSNKLYEQCREGNVAAIIWYEKTRRGLTDKLQIKAEDLDRDIERELARVAGGEEGADVRAPATDAVN